MKKFKLNGHQGFVAGVVVTAMVSLPFTSAADTVTKSIAASLSNVKVTLGGQALDLQDAAGNSLEPIVYNKSVYVPVRALSDALGVTVEYDNSTKTVALTEGSSDAATGTGTPPAGGVPGDMPAGGMPGGTTDTSDRVTDIASSTLLASTAETASASATTEEQSQKVAALADAFLATLTDEQKESLQFDLTEENASVWSNLPAGAVQRNGLMFATLSEESVAALKALLVQALGDNGYDMLQEIMIADEYLATDNNTQMWDSDLYYIAFLGTPSATSPWTLQVSGHHYASNTTYNADQEAAVTPVFVGVEPQSFTYAGEQYEPLESRREAMYDMIQSLDTAQLASAQIDGLFDDVLLGPGQDGNFPSTSEGIEYSSLDTEQQELVKAAITEWVEDTSPDISAELLESYLSDEALAETKIGWSGSTDSGVHGSYIRIDGPRVWIEFVCQTGVAYQDQIHFHTIWRDKVADYGGSFSTQ